MIPESGRAPVLEPESLYYWNVYWLLHYDRFNGMSIGGIPFVAIDAYANRFGVDGDDFETLLFIIRSLDAAFMKHQAKAK